MPAWAPSGWPSAAVGWVTEPAPFYAGWLAAVRYCSWALGSMALLLIHALTGGRWGEALRPALRIGMCSLPLLLPAVVPLLAGLRDFIPGRGPAIRPTGSTSTCRSSSRAARST